ncbi:unnamed protein product [Rhizopus stolonifer]
MSSNNSFPDIMSNVHFLSLKDNPEAQSMLLMALLSSNSDNAVNPTDESDQQLAASPTASEVASVIHDSEKRKFESLDANMAKETSPSRRVGRKPVTSDDDESDDPKNKRKAQNRAAQRAFRERKENHVRVLEERVKELEKSNTEKNTELQMENKILKEMIQKLQSENASLLSSFNYPLPTNEFEERPQKVVRASSSPRFDSFDSSTASVSSTHTPENIHDILNFDAGLPSSALLDHSELLGNATSSFDGLFSADPKQFDFFYPLDKPTSNQDTTDDMVKLWDKMNQSTNHEEFDLDSLCDEMKKKAQCDEFHHNEEFSKLVDKHIQKQ